MKRSMWKPLMVAVLVLVAGAGYSVCVAAGDKAETPDAARLSRLQSSGLDARILIFPARVLDRADANVADVLGLVLENHGLMSHDVVDVAFDTKTPSDWDATMEAFKAFIANSKLKGDYALYAEYLGTPKTGPTEVRWVLTDTAGAVVISDRQTPDSRDFKRIAARDPDPMGCSMLVAERLFSTTGWKKTHPDANNPGRFARKWAEKSGLPDAAERRKMDERLKLLNSKRKTAVIEVYPASVNGAADPAVAKSLADDFSMSVFPKSEFCRVTADVKLAPSSNEQKRLWDLARAFREAVRKSPPEGDYAVIAEYIVSKEGKPAHSVHVVICDKSGEWVLVDMQNNQHDDFKSVNPITPEDCNNLLIRRLNRLLN